MLVRATCLTCRSTRGDISRAPPVSERKVVLTSTLLTLITLTAFSQAQQQQPKVESKAPRPTATPPAKLDDDIIRTSTNLVQVDAVVIDKHGRQVSGLTASDFEIVEGGRSISPEYCSYVSIGTLTPEKSPGAQPSAGDVRRVLSSLSRIRLLSLRLAPRVPEVVHRVPAVATPRHALKEQLILRVRC